MASDKAEPESTNNNEAKEQAPQTLASQATSGAQPSVAKGSASKGSAAQGSAAQGSASKSSATQGSTSKGRKAASPSGTQGRAPETEYEPVLSGRLMIALVLLLAMVVIPVSGLARVLTKEAPQTADRKTWNVGDTATIHLTVVTSDYNDLACADARTIDGAHCEFENDRERFPAPQGGKDHPVDDNKAKTLQPYRTTDNNLLLAAGLWAQPEIATRLHFEPPRGVAKDKLARFVTSCRVEFLAEWENPLVRWKSSDKWSENGKAMVTRLLSCKILEESKE